MPETPETASPQSRRATRSPRAAKSTARTPRSTTSAASPQPEPTDEPFIPTTVTSPPVPVPLVTAVLVSHDGERWIQQTLDALAAQTLTPQRIVAVDTGSIDGTAALLVERLGPSAVIRPPRDTPLGHAVAAGVAAFTGAPAPAGGRTAPPEWIWILHDDCAPEPGALAALLARADGSPSIWAVAPKTRDWSGQRIAEFGATVDRVGHREIWLEGHDLDQGQADARVEALAGSTAGLLIRRSAWETLGGIDDLGWPLSDDLDFGWQINAAGGRVALASDAVVRHVGALQHGLRSIEGDSSPTAARRQAGMSVVLANSPAGLAPILWFRVAVGAFWRALGSLIVLRRPRSALDELVASAAVVRSAGRISRARKERRSHRVVPHRELSRLLAGVSDRARHLLDAFRTGLPTRASAERLQLETGPVDESAESLDTDDGAALRRWLTRPSVALTLLSIVVGLIADRNLLAGGLAGGRLLPAPSGAHSLWSAYLAGFHPVGVGTSALATPALAVLAAIGTLFFGHAALVVDLIVLFTVPMAALSAWHATKPLTGSVPLRLWAAAAWAVLPAVLGAVSDGRLDSCVAAILLPVVGRVTAGALVAATGSAREWSGRLAGAGLLLGVLTAFAPVLWVLVLLATALTLLVGVDAAGRRLRGLAVIGVTAFAVCEPWAIDLIRHPKTALAGLGLPDPSHRSPLSASRLILLHPFGNGTGPLWIGAVLLLVALAGLVRRSPTGGIGWAALVTGLGGAVAISRLHGILAGSPASRASASLPLELAGLGAIVAAIVAADDVRASLRRRRFGVAQPAAAVLAVLAVAAAGWGAIGWMVRGAGQPLHDKAMAVAPLYVGDALSTPTSPRALLISGRRQLVVSVIRKPSGGDLIDASLSGNSATGHEDTGRAALQQAVADLVAGRSAAIAELADLDVYFIVVDSDAAGAVAHGANALGAALTPATGAVVYRLPGVVGELTIAPTGTSNPPAVVALDAGIDGTSRTDIAMSTSPRELDLAEPASSHWHATLDGKTLASTAARNGWEQGWQVPAERGGSLRVSWSDPARSAELIIEALLVLAVALLAVPFWRLDRGDDDA